MLVRFRLFVARDRIHSMRVRTSLFTTFLLVGLFLGFGRGTGAASAMAQVGPPALAPSVEGGAAVDTFSVDDVVRQALDDNPAIRAAQQARVAASASVREVQSERFPVLQGETNYRRLSGNIDYTADLSSIPGLQGEPVTFAPAIVNRYAARASVEQPIFTGFRISNRVEAARARTQAAQAEGRLTQSEVSYNARVAYWTLYEARAREEALADAVRQLERRLTDTRNRREVGRTTESEVLRVKARRDQVRVERLQAESEAASARRTLNDQMGRPLDATVVLEDTVTLANDRYEEEVLADRARELRPDLEALRQTVRAREAEVDAAQSNWYPQLALTGSYLYGRPNEQLFPPEDRFRGTWEVGVHVSWRLSTGGRTDAATDRAEARRLQARYELEDRRRAVTVEVKKQFQNVRQAREAVLAAETSLESAREATRSVRSHYEEGMTVLSDLLEAERTLREARARLAAGQADYGRARAAFLRAIGQTRDIDPGSPGR